MRPQINKRLSIIFFTSIAVVFLPVLYIKYSGYRFNFTESFPYGVYQDIEDKTLKKGDFVVFCPPKNEIFDFALSVGFLAPGECPSGSVPLLKKIVATEGDLVTIDKKVFVDGVEQKNSTLQKFPFKSQTQIIKKNKIFLMSDFYDMSFDSRYFGAIDSNQVISKVRPVLTWY